MPSFLLSLFIASSLAILLPGIPVASGNPALDQACSPRVLRRLIEDQERPLSAIQRRRNIEAQKRRELSNRESRIESSLERLNDEKALLPSEIREFRKAADDLRNQGRLEEAGLLESRVNRQERRRGGKSRRPLSAAEEKLIQRRVIMTRLAEKQLKSLPPPVAEMVNVELLLQIAKDPTSGTNYSGQWKIDGIPVSNYKKIKFSGQTHYRLIYRVDDEGIAIIEAIGPRESVYRGKFKGLNGSF